MSPRWEWPTESGALYFGPATAEARPAGEPGPEGARRRAVFLDRDGVLIEGVPEPVTGLIESALRVEDVRLLPGVATALRALSSAGYALVCTSNQPAAAKGKITLEQTRAIHERVIALLAECGAGLDASYLCPHHPQGIVAALARRCACRKPAPGMLLEASRRFGLVLGRSWMVGDTDTDVEAGRAAGCRTALLSYGGAAHKRSGDASPDLLVRDLSSAAAGLLDHSHG